MGVVVRLFAKLRVPLMVRTTGQSKGITQCSLSSRVGDGFSRRCAGGSAGHLLFMTFLHCYSIRELIGEGLMVRR